MDQGLTRVAVRSAVVRVHPGLTDVVSDRRWDVKQLWRRCHAPNGVLWGLGSSSDLRRARIPTRLNSGHLTRSGLVDILERWEFHRNGPAQMGAPGQPTVRRLTGLTIGRGSVPRTHPVSPRIQERGSPDDRAALAVPDPAKYAELHGRARPLVDGIP